MDTVIVRFQLLSGKCALISVPHGASGAVLYAQAASFAGCRNFFLAMGTNVIPFDGQTPLLRFKDTCFTLNIVRASKLEAETDTLFDIVRRRQWLTALTKLKSSFNPRALILQRDASGDTLLSWVAYGATRDQLALELIRFILSVVPSEAKARCPYSGFLALHDAAWGGAMVAVAELLVAAYPHSLEVMSRSRETPSAVALYYHGAGFWPSAEELRERASALRAFTRQRCIFNAVQRPQLEPARWLPHTLLPRVADFLGTAAPAPHLMAKTSPQPSSALLGPRAEPLCPQRSPQLRSRLSRTSCRQRTRHLWGSQADGPELVVYIQEAAAKERGRLAGAGQVRNRRCSFLEASKVVVGCSHVVHQLHVHAVRAVGKEVQRLPPAPKWPCKAAMRRQRTLDRIEKLQPILDV